jgi:hypothetical protein
VLDAVLLHMIIDHFHEWFNRLFVGGVDPEFPLRLAHDKTTILQLLKRVGDLSLLKACLPGDLANVLWSFAQEVQNEQPRLVPQGVEETGVRTALAILAATVVFAITGFIFHMKYNSYVIYILFARKAALHSRIGNNLKC